MAATASLKNVSVRMRSDLQERSVDTGTNDRKYQTGNETYKAAHAKCFKGQIVNLSKMNTLVCTHPHLFQTETGWMEFLH